MREVEDRKRERRIVLKRFRRVNGWIVVILEEDVEGREEEEGEVLDLGRMLEGCEVEGREGGEREGGVLMVVVVKVRGGEGDL